eukprot:317450_1
MSDDGLFDSVFGDLFGAPVVSERIVIVVKPPQLPVSVQWDSSMFRSSDLIANAIPLDDEPQIAFDMDESVDNIKKAALSVTSDYMLYFENKGDNKIEFALSSDAIGDSLMDSDVMSQFGDLMKDFSEFNSQIMNDFGLVQLEPKMEKFDAYDHYDDGMFVEENDRDMNASISTLVTLFFGVSIATFLIVMMKKLLDSIKDEFSELAERDGDRDLDSDDEEIILLPEEQPEHIGAQYQVLPDEFSVSAGDEAVL